MKIIKYLFFLLLIIIIAGAIYIATKDGEYHLEETAIINAPAPVVFNEVNNYQNWESWGFWRNETDDMIINTYEPPRGEGAGFSWKSDDLGDGSIQTTNVVPDHSIDQKLIHHPTFAESRGDMYWKFEEVDEGTRVTVGVTGKQSFKEKFGFTFNDRDLTQIMRQRFSAGLERLDEEIRFKMSQYTINVDGETTHGGGFYMYSSTASKLDQIPERMQQLQRQVELYMDNNNITRQGSPVVIYNNWDEQNNSAIYSVGIFTPSLVITPSESNVLNGMMPVQRVVKTTLNGDRDNLKEAWDTAYRYIQQNNLQVDENKQAFEVYRTPNETTLNPANHITEIYIPLLEATVEGAPDIF